MPRYGVLWLEIAEQQYHALPAHERRRLDAVLDQLVEDPTGDQNAVYDARSDHWSVPVGELGFLFYAVVDSRATLIVLRIVHGLT